MPSSSHLLSSSHSDTIYRLSVELCSSAVEMNTFNEPHTPGFPRCTSIPLSERLQALPTPRLPGPEHQLPHLPVPTLPPAYYHPGAYTSPFRPPNHPPAFGYYLPTSPTYLPQSGISPIPPISPALSQSHSSPPPVTTSPASESRPLDFLFPLSRSPETCEDIGRDVDDAIAKLLSAPPKTSSSLPRPKKSSSLIVCRKRSPLSGARRSSCASSTVTSRQSSLERRLLSLQPRTPTQHLLDFLLLHIASIQREQRHCLQDGLLPADYSRWLSQRYTEQLHLVLNSVERSLQVLERQHGSQDERTHPASRALDPEAVRLMDDWYQRHPENLYPTQLEAEELADRGGITVQQLRKWFANRRHRSRKAKEAPAREFEEFVSRVFIT